MAQKKLREVKSGLREMDERWQGFWPSFLYILELSSLNRVNSSESKKDSY